MGRGKQRLAQKKRLEKQGESDKRLYICTYEFCRGGKAGYRVQTIGMSDLFRCMEMEIDTPIPKMFSCEFLHQVAFLHGQDVPKSMSFGVLGSRIVLLGGWFPNGDIDDEDHPLPTYVLETKEPNPSFISSTSCTSFKSSFVIPQLGGINDDPWLPEINGKLYALTGHCLRRSGFDVFDPENVSAAVWAPLPSLRIPRDSADAQTLAFNSSCAVVGTKIFVILPVRLIGVKIFCFDVAHPKKGWTTHEPLCLGSAVGDFPGSNNEVLVLDLENLEKKLMFSFDNCFNRILVSRMLLSSGGKPYCINQVASIQLPAPAFTPASYRCCHLGGRIVCFVFMRGHSILVFTFEFSYSSSSFSIKRSGRLLFEFEPNLGKQLTWGDLCGCFAL